MGEECRGVDRKACPQAKGLSLVLVLLAAACGGNGAPAGGPPPGDPPPPGNRQGADAALRERFDALVEAQSSGEEGVHELDEFLDGLTPEEQLGLAEHAAEKEFAFRQVAIELFLRHQRRERAVDLIVDGLKRGEDLLSVVVFSLLHSDPEAADGLLAAVREEVAAQRPRMTPEEIAAVERLLDS